MRAIVLLGLFASTFTASTFAAHPDFNPFHFAD
jgi:hypothetical protein